MPHHKFRKGRIDTGMIVLMVSSIIPLHGNIASGIPLRVEQVMARPTPWKSPFDRNDRDPLTVSFVVVCNGATHTLCDIFRQHVAVVSEELFLDALPPAPILQQWMRRLVLGGEDD